MELINALGIIASILSLPLAIVGLFKVIQDITSKIKRFISWKQIEKWVNELTKNIHSDNAFIPDCIVPMGRGGAVMAAMMSRKLSSDHVTPIFMVDRSHLQINNKKVANILFDFVDFKKLPKNILLVAGMNVSGTTLKAYDQWLKSHNAPEIKIKSAVLVESQHPICKADFVYKHESVNPKLLKMPWYKGVGADWDGSLPMKLQ